MKEVKEHLAMADGLLAKIPANGDALMLLAAARRELAAAFSILPKEPDTTSEESEGVTDG